MVRKRVKAQEGSAVTGQRQTKPNGPPRSNRLMELSPPPKTDNSMELAELSSNFKVSRFHCVCSFGLVLAFLAQLTFWKPSVLTSHASMMTFGDRTSEFSLVAQALRNNGLKPTTRRRETIYTARMNINKLASEIGKDTHATAQKLQVLTRRTNGVIWDAL